MLVRRVYSQSLLVLILSSMISMLGALVDGMVIGNMLGDDAIAAYGYALPLTVLITGIAYAISGGGQALCGKAIGKGDQKEADRYFTAVIFASLVFGLLVTVLCILLVDPVSVLLGAPRSEAEIFSQTKAYLLGYLPCSAFNMLTLSLSSFMHLENAQRRAVSAAVIGTIVNIIGDFMALRLFHGGLFEIAIATTVSYAVMTLVLLLYYTGRERVLHFNRSGVGLRRVGRLFLFGLPSADIQICSVFRSVFLNRLLFFIAAEGAVSAFSIRMSMYNLYGSIVIGFGLATLLVGSFFIGEENTDAIRQLLKSALQLGVFVTAVLCLFVWIVAPVFVDLYTNDPEVMQMAISSIRWFALSLPLFVVNSILAKYYQAMNMGWLSHLITILENLIYVCLFALILGLRFSTDGVWIAFVVTEAVTLLTILVVVMVRRRRFPRALLDWMLLPEGFGIPAEQALITECRVKEDVTKVAQNVTDFLMAHGETEHQANRLCLCTEELMMNSFQYVQKPHRPHSVYLMLLQKQEEWLLCIRDLGKSFDPKEWLAYHEGSVDHLGLTLVRAAGDDITFLHTLTMNQITIHLKKEGGRIRL